MGESVQSDFTPAETKAIKESFDALSVEEDPIKERVFSMKNASRVTGLNKKRASTILLLRNKDISFILFRKFSEYFECRNLETRRASPAQIHRHCRAFTRRSLDSGDPFLRQVSDILKTNDFTSGLIYFWRSPLTELTFCSI